MLTATRGTIAVPRRDPELAARLGESVDFPVGDDLMHAIAGRRERQSESAAIRSLAKEMGTTVGDVIDAFLDGEEIGTQTVRRFLTNTGLKPLFSPIVEDGLRLGLNRVAGLWQSLIARTVRIDQMSYEYYEFDNATTGAQNEFKLNTIGQGAPIPVARVSVSGKSYTLYKTGRGIEWTDEAKAAPIDLAAMWFQQVGLQLGLDYHADVVDKLLNGYFADNSDDPNVLATATANVFTDADLYTAAGTLQNTYGYTADVMLMSLATSVTIQTLENGTGQRLFPNGVTAAGLPRIQVSASMPADKILFVDSGFSLVRFVYKDFGTEFDRSPQTQVEGSYGTQIDLVVPLFKDARLVLDA
jgi:hypothetical protein